MAKKKSFWESLEVKTGKQITLWVLTIVIAVLFSNNLVEAVSNITTNPLFFAFLYFGSFFAFRIILGYLFDERLK